MKNPLLEVKQISQHYGSGSKIFVAIDALDLQIKEGEFVAIVGPSGCGKSTLLRIITGLQKPTSGEVLYRQKKLRGVNPHATIVFQAFALFPWLTVQENVEVALKANGLDKSSRVRRAIELLDRVGLDGFENAYPRELSGGMRQKVGFARAMAVEPELLCLDEPFSALDILSAENLRGELLELWTTGKIPTKAILMITHNIEEAIFMADRVIVMDKDPGRVVAELKVMIPHPRNRKDKYFISQLDKIYAMLAGKNQSDSLESRLTPQDKGKALPSITPGELTGFLEHLHEAANVSNIYQLEKDLKISSAHVLRAIEAARLLHFVTISAGDIALTPLGEIFAEATMQVRKEIFAKRIKRLSLFKWLLEMLDTSDDHSMEWDVIKTALEIEFSPKIAEKQLDLLIQWGRYGELLTYNDTAGVIYLET